MTSLFDQNDTPDRETLAAKWADKPIADVINAKVESDLYIRELTSTMDQMRQDLLETRNKANEQAKLQDLIDRLENLQNEPVAKPDANDVKPSFDSEDLEGLISKKIQETEAQKIASKNFSEVENKLKDKFGNNFKQILQEKANTLGLSVEDIDNLARKSPTAFFNVLGFNEQSDEKFSLPPRSNTNSNSFTPAVKKRTWAYWQEVRKSDPKEYYDPKNTLLRIKDAEVLGEDFKDGDYRLYGH